MKNITVETVRAVLDYEPDTGIFRWRVSCGNVKAGAAAGSVRSDAWLYTHGVMPQDQIDHLNGDKRDNRIANLRDVSQFTNQQNQTRPRTDNISGYRGVSWERGNKRWRAQIRANGRLQYLGYFDCAKEAHAAYLAAKLRFHPGDIRHL